MACRFWKEIIIAFASVFSYGIFATASQPSEANCAKLGADKVTMKVVSHKRPKLGTQYTAYAVAWKYDK